MNNVEANSYFLISFLALSLLFLNGCKEPVEIQSKWTDKEITIDADDNDWKDYPFLYDEETRSLVGVYNNDADLYICFQVMDEGIQRQIMAQGLLIWFNQAGNKDREWAIKHPVGRDLGDLGGHPPWLSDMPKSPPRDSSDKINTPQESESPGRKRPPGGNFGRVPAPYPELRILTSKKGKGKRYLLREAVDIGIHVKCAIDQRGRLIYELKMPLLKSDKKPYAAAALKVNTIGMGFMTIESKNRSQGGGRDRGGMGRGGGMPGGGGPGGGSGGGMPGGGGPGGGPGGGRPGGGGPGGGMQGQDNSLKIWTKITLAPNQSTE